MLPAPATPIGLSAIIPLTIRYPDDVVSRLLQPAPPKAPAEAPPGAAARAL
jgi:hypothetical protein